MPTVHAPEIPRDLPWLNTTRPLALRELRGQLVILDFWTYCCINCMHVLPVLRRIEERHAADPLVVIGVHSAKFEEEKDARRIEEAIRRYDVRHPVVVDRDMAVWQAFAVRSWPTLVVVRPDGTIAAVAPGEPDPGVLDQFIEEELALARRKGQLASAPFAVHAPPRAEEGPLSFPGKVAIGPRGLVAVSDSGHDRVLVVDGDGRVVHVVGSGLAGLADGPFAAAAFDDPQGLAWRGESEIFVADARAHAVRRIDLARGEVTTIAGTGELGEGPLRGTLPARTTRLRSPWDVAVDGDVIHVALAGSHQIAAIDLRDGTIAVVAGTGAESIVDGPFAVATFSQPSGLARDGRRLYVADSETSAVRVIDLDAREVRTLVGVGLFDFGDRDGPRQVARMQHCIGLALDGEGALVVADTYNHKLRHVDRATGEVRTLRTGGLAEPAGLAWDAQSGAWMVADTNHHRLVRVSADGRLLVPMALEGVPAPRRGRIEHAAAPGASLQTEWFTQALAPVDGAALAPGEVTMTLPVSAPAGKKLAAGATITVSLEVSRRSDLLVLAQPELRATANGEATQTVTIAARVEALPSDAIDAEVVARVEAIVCTFAASAEAALCEPYRAWLRLPIRLARDGGAHVDFAER